MENIRPIRQFFKKYFCIMLPAAYGFFYLYVFDYLEKTVTTNFHIVHMRIDDYIPFCEFFVIPYFLWFAYIAVTFVSFLFLDRKDYYRLCIMLGCGMTLFLAVSFLFPNGHQLRPHIFPRDNIFVDMVRQLYRTDTPTNLFPSIHCYNSLAAHMAVSHCRQLKQKKWIQGTSLFLCISIILSTVFIKQHSMFDVLTAFALAGFMHYFVYTRTAKGEESERIPIVMN